MKLFQRTSHRLDKMEHDLANTNDLAVSINEAVDRVEGDLKKATDWVTTADGVVVNLSAGVQKLSDLSASRIVDLEQRVDALEKSDEINRAVIPLHVKQIEAMKVQINDQLATVNENFRTLADAAKLEIETPAARTRRTRRPVPKSRRAAA